MNEWINEEKVKYFDLLEYISKIKLTDKVLYHLEDTSKSFEQYMKLLAQLCDYNNYASLYYWLNQNYNDLVASNKIENKDLYNTDLFKSNLFFDKLTISHERIKHIHRFVCEHSNTNKIAVGEYRKQEASIGAFHNNNEYQVYWYAVSPKDIKPFMNRYLEFYRTNNVRLIYANPFLKSALAHLLFVRIHPFGDGNGRTARIIHNICFTAGINKIYNVKLKLSPLNISENIYINRHTYVDCINRIYFNIDVDNNKAINNWFDFILNMYDEQIYYQTNRMPELTRSFKSIHKLQDDKVLNNEANKLIKITTKFK